MDSGAGLLKVMTCSSREVSTEASPMMPRKMASGNAEVSVFSAVTIGYARAVVAGSEFEDEGQFACAV